MSSVAELERAGAQGASALARCTGDPAAFLRETWGRRALVRRGSDPRGFADLLTLDDVDRMLSTTGLRSPSFRLVKAGERIPESSYTRSGRTGSKPVSGIADPGAIVERFRTGATIVLQGLHRYHEPVTRFVRDLELELGHSCQVNAYITPPGAQGLELHEDGHDVFVLQAFGSKAWEVHAAPGETEREPVHAQVVSGDTIYMPRGTRHAASTQTEVSGHLTVGVHVRTWRDLLARAWREVERDPAFDEPVPAGWMGSPHVARELAERLAAAASALGRVEARELLEDHRIVFGSSRASLLRGVMEDLLRLDEIDDATLLERRPGSVCEVVPRGGRLLVLLGDRRLEMPAWVEPALRRVARAPSLRPMDLADELPDPSSQLVLVRRLVREGLLRPAG